MLFLRTLLIAAVAAAQISHASRTDPVLVEGVVSGDAVTIQSIGRVRLLGIKAPAAERGVLRGEPFGREALDRLAALASRRWVRLEFDRSGSRRAAYVLLEDGTCLNTVLVREGLARVTGGQSLSRFQELKDAESTARTTHRGIWR
jgi:endonuclease YncB( thermonuclease family)